MRTLVRSLGHTGKIYRFFTVMARQAHEHRHVLEQIEVFHRGWRAYVTGDGQPYQLRPDGYGVMHLRSGGRSSFFLEWELRSDRPGRYVSKLRPYLRYYQHRMPLEQLSDWPYLLFVLRDEIAEAGLLRVASPEIARSGIQDVLRLRTSTEELVASEGPLSAVWRDRPGGPRVMPWQTG